MDSDSVTSSQSEMLSVKSTCKAVLVNSILSNYQTPYLPYITLYHVE